MKKIITLIVFSAMILPAFAQVSGTAFRDFNANGNLQNTATYTETGLAGLVVTAYNSSNTIIASFTTQANGTYSIPASGAAYNGVLGSNTGFVAAATAVRLEFTNQSFGDYTSSAGSTTVQFATAPATAINAGFNAPKDYITNSNTPMFIPQMWGASAPDATASASAAGMALGVFNEANSGVLPVPTKIATLAQIGNVWGTAYHKQSKTVFAATFFRKYGGYAAGGQSAIYAVKAGVDGSFGTADDVVSTFIKLDDYFGANSTGANAFAVKPLGDSLLTSKVAYGDIEISADGKTLYAVNLGDRKIYRIPLTDAGTTPALGTITASTLPVPSATTCTGALGIMRPFGLTVKNGDGKLYVSATCQGAARMYVWGYNPATDAWDVAPIIDFSPIFPGSCCWDAWNTTVGYAKVPLAMGLDFDPSGRFLNLTYVTRRVFTEGTRSIGNIMRFCNNNGTWTMENNGSVCGVTGAGVGNGQGPGGGEFYDDTSADGPEVSISGAALQIPGRPNFAVTQDDITTVYTSGVRYLNNNNGTQAYGYVVRPSYLVYPPPANEFDGKLNNLGDIEYTSEIQPIEIGNRVWNDADGDGIQDAGEAGMANIPVQIFNGITQVGTTTTNTDGTWFFNNTNVTLGGAAGLVPNTAYTIRVAAAALPVGKILTVANVGGAGQADVRDSDAAMAAGNVEIAYTTGGNGQNDHTLDMGFAPMPVTTPPTGAVASTCNNTPLMATPIYVNGNPLGGGNSGTNPGFALFQNTNIGESTAPQTTFAASQLGTVWGVAYNQQQKKIFTSAFFKRHAGFGQGGVGAIYTINPKSATPAATVYVDLTTLGVDVGTDTRNPADPNNALPTTITGVSRDINAFDAVGKRSLGGLDVSADGTKMYVMNLFKNELVALDITGAAPTLIGKYAVPNPNCSNNDARAWAVKCHAGKVYVGVVCTAETSGLRADLYASIYEFNPTTSAYALVYGFPLDYQRGQAGMSGGVGASANWLPWHSTWGTVHPDPNVIIYPQPILSDIEFDMNGEMILGFLDRNGHQTGNGQFAPISGGSTNPTQGHNAGDILRVGLVGGAYQLEANGVASGAQAQAPNCFGGAPINGANNAQGPANGEYYWGDTWRFNPCVSGGAGTHEEISFGGLAFIPGSNEVAMTSMDPTETAFSGGITWLSNTTGKRTHLNTANEYDATQHGYRLYDPTVAGNFGKTAGLGDLEVFCMASEATIGNYVWNDTNNDGINNEPATAGINGVTVELYKETAPASGIYTLVQTTTTANDAVTTNPGAYKFTVTETANYYVKFPTANGTKVLTTQTATAATDNNSDANTTTGASPIFAMDVNGTGILNDNTTIDAGYKCATTATITGVSQICVAANTVLTASGAGVGGTYLWDDASTNPTLTVTPAVATAYTVTVTESNGCSATASIVLEPLPTIIAVSAVSRLCLGNNTNLTANAVGAVSYIWNTTETTAMINVAPSQTTVYTVTATYNNGCTASTTVNLEVLAQITVSNVIKTNPTTCVPVNGSIEIIAAGSPSTPLQYRLTGTVTTAWQSSNIFTGLGAGNYLVSVRYQGGSCTFVNGVTTLVAPAPLTANITAACNGANTVLTANTPTIDPIFVWNTGATTPSIAITSAGFYSVTVTDAGGCTTTATIEATMLACAALVGDHVWNDANKDGLQNGSETPIPSVKVYLYDKNNLTTPIDSAQTTPTGDYQFTILTAGNYAIRFQDLAGWTRTKTTTNTNDGSDADQITGWIAPFAVVLGTNNMALDAGYSTTTLPVKMLYFTGDTRDCNVNLKWATASELNSKEFTVERSADGKSWTALATVKSAGTTNIAQYYEYKDEKPLRTNYYRLVQMDFDGKTEIFNLNTQISASDCYGDIINGISALYPNPSGAGAVNVKCFTDRNDTEAVEFVLYDMLGRKMQTTTKTITRGANVISLDISDLPTGTYMLNMVGNGWYSEAQKLMKL